jgi:hypothetical protein
LSLKETGFDQDGMGDRLGAVTKTGGSQYAVPRRAKQHGWAYSRRRNQRIEVCE